MAEEKHKYVMAYPLMEDVMCYADCANARQKLRLVGESLSGVVIVPPGKKDLIPPEYKGAVMEAAFLPRSIVQWVRLVRGLRGRIDSWGHPVSNELTCLTAVAISLFSGVKTVLFCWDPPGVSVRNRRDVISRVRCWLMDRLLALAILSSCGFILNLHPGFLEGRFSRRVMDKIKTFPNGTTVAKNDAVARRIQKIPKRLAVACRVSPDKGCWLLAELFSKLYKMDNEVSLVWVGGGEVDAVRSHIKSKGVPDDSLIMTGALERDATLEWVATGMVSLNVYHDVPSLRWNYLLKAPEALSLGQPIVSSRLPGVCEYARDGETGVIYDETDVDLAAKRIHELLSNSSDCVRMGVAARQLAREYDWERINASIAKTVKSWIGLSC